MRKGKGNRQKGAAGRVYTIEIERRRSADDTPYLQRFLYTAATDADTVATALLSLNDREPLADVTGARAEPIAWECSCLQKKCGACAMVICGEPMLACDARLSRLPERIHLAPLRKFPVVRDLLIDRSIMRQNLKKAMVFAQKEISLTEKQTEDAYEASRCLQCGICLEVCPNFDPAGGFTGVAAAVPAARVMAPGAPAAEGYRKYFFEGCGKSLACRKVCPAGIEIGEMLAQSNAVAVWKRFK